MKAMVIGASGATGREIVDVLLKDERFENVVVMVRRSVFERHEKLEERVVDFDREETWGDMKGVDVLFSALGTTLKDAGSKEAQYKIDYGYQFRVAEVARESGVRYYALVSSMGADEKSGFFYMRMKGELERDVKKLGFVGTYIFQPPSLEREGRERLMEKVSLAVFKFFNGMGLLMGYMPMKTSELAGAMVRKVVKREEGVFVIGAREMR